MIFTELSTLIAGEGKHAIPLGVLGIRLVLNTIISLTLILGVYRTKQRSVHAKRDLTFTFIVFNVLIFFVASLLAVSSMKTGIAFALFAVFSILRYRTVQMEIVDMTFLFICIIVAVINSTVTHAVETWIILGIDLFIVVLTGVLFHVLYRSWGESLSIRFEYIELMTRSRKQELIDELAKRTGCEILGYEVVNINYTQDYADLIVHCGSELNA